MLKLWITILDTSQGEDNYQYEELENPSYQQIVKAVESFPWQAESENMEKYGECGGIMFHRTEGEARIEISLNPLESNTQGMMLITHIRCKRGFLGFGRQSCARDFMDIDMGEVKMILHDFYSMPCESLYQRYA